MGKDNILNGIIPRPVRITVNNDKLVVNALNSIHAQSGLQRYGDELIQAFQYFGKSLKPTDSEGADIKFSLDSTLAAEGWGIVISPEAIRICGGSPAGLFYALSAMYQLLVLGFARGPASASFDCGTIEDHPRFEWRGLMLDSVRHFQSKEKIKEVIQLIAAWRLNVFHWHLSDGQGVRLPFALLPPQDESNGRYYSKEDLKEIAAFAAARFVRIVPELDMPGHSTAFLKQFPHYACDPDHPGDELCLGNPEARTFLKAMLDEMMDIFPDSPIIHLGGDEANTSAWEHCPKCQDALRRAGLSRMRELENQFMNEMTRHIIACGRRPMVWCTDSVHPTDTIVQAWQNITEIINTCPHGNSIVNSVHYCCYLDYPANSEDFRALWMPELSEGTVYQSFEPPTWMPELRDRILGTEACLWTETVPEWRVLPKLSSRLMAFAENAWSQLERKDWHDFQRRKMQLEAAGYCDFLRNTRFSGARYSEER